MLLSRATIVQPRTVNLLATLYLVVFANGPFWHFLSSKLELDTSRHWALLLITALMLILVINGLLSLFSFKPVHKPFIISLILVAAAVNYYMESYGIVINKQMITNLIETDFKEASEQITWPFMRHVLLFGILPSILLIMSKITYRNWKHELLEKTAIIAGSVVALAALTLVNFKSITLFGRTYPELRMYINPTYPLYSFIKVLSGKHKNDKEVPVRIVAPDAVKSANGHKSLFVLVVGETARAEEFSLNGYERNTNPELMQTANLFNFTDVDSCGTDTAESLPCMFSHLGQNSYSRNKANKYENALDILQRTGVRVVWLDNNSGSKGVADRIPVESFSKTKDDTLCSSEECFDEIMLKGLDSLLASNNGDMLLVLHQKGSHGPSYYKRSPARFKFFKPECTQDNVQDCDPQHIRNAYDNTIVYTDHFLAKVIERLRKEPYPSAMLYASDHGESLGENNIYLHGLPYAIAPKQQTRVPMIFWGSNTFLKEKNIDVSNLNKHLNDHLSHDYLFHTILGAFSIKTRAYKPRLDLLHLS